jgi:hydroxymethylpyrimidine/phosphomethylpyrimidine kinase
MPLNNSRSPIALSIAGFDPTGGAGVIADVKTFHALGCHGLAVVTAITAQNSLGVFNVEPLKATLALAQLQALFDDFPIDAIKIGMLASAEIAQATANFLNTTRPQYIVLDPLIYSSSGYPLVSPAARKIVYEELFPLATIITPNLAEAALWSDAAVTDLASMRAAAARICQQGANSVLIKGGHLAEDAEDGDEVIDLFYDGSDYRILRAARINRDGIKSSAHGTGCALSSAIAALLAQGK